MFPAPCWIYTTTNLGSSIGKKGGVPDYAAECILCDKIKMRQPSERKIVEEGSNKRSRGHVDRKKERCKGFGEDMRDEGELTFCGLLTARQMALWSHCVS